MKLKIMSFNLRFDTPSDGINQFTKRLPKIFKLIKDEAPDIIGFQEVTDSMRAKIKAGLDGYDFEGCGRDANYHGEAMLIAYRADAFELISCDNVWLSETPSVPGSRYYGDHSGCPRMYTVLKLKHNDIALPFRFINTHLDHEGACGRLLEATQLTKAISQFEEKFILTGDFNAKPSAPEIKLITEALSDKGVIDCTASLEPTFHNFGRLKGDAREKIDYIFTDAKCDSAYLIKDEGEDGQYYSDHNAVCAIIEL